jgi:hypothetical protein
MRHEFGPNPQAPELQLKQPALQGLRIWHTDRENIHAQDFKN